MTIEQYTASTIDIYNASLIQPYAGYTINTTDSIYYPLDPSDAWAVNLVAGNTYVIDLVAGSGASGTLHDWLHDSHGVSIPESAITIDGSRFIYTPTYTGTFYVNVYSDAQAAYSGDYNLSIRTYAPSADISDTIRNTTSYYLNLSQITLAGTVASGHAVTGTVDILNDYGAPPILWGTSLLAGHTYQIRLSGAASGGGSLSDPYLYGILDSAGHSIANTSNDDIASGNKDSEVTFTPTQSGAYNIFLGGYAEKTGSYTLSVTDKTASIINPSQATLIQLHQGSASNVSGSLNLSSHTHDVWAINMTAGDTYSFDISALSGSAGQADYWLYDSVGNPIAASLLTVDGSTCSYTAATSGIFYANVYGDPQLGYSGNYSFSVREYAPSESLTSILDVSEDYFVDLADTAFAGNIASGQAVTGTVHILNDYGVPPILWGTSLLAGHSYQINLRGVDGGGGSLSNPYLYGILDQSGYLLSNIWNDNISSVNHDSRLDITVNTSGVYSIFLGGYDGSTGTYTLDIADTTARSSQQNSVHGVGTLEPASGGAALLNGLISVSGQPYAEAIKVQAGHTYQIDLQGLPSWHGTLADPTILGVLDGSVQLIANTSNDDISSDNKDAQVVFTAATTGTDYILFGGSAGCMGTYTLTVTDKTNYAGGGGTIGGGDLPVTFSNEQLELVKLYLAAFLRAPDKGGFEYWSDKLAAGESFSSVVDTIFSLPIVKEIYPDSISNAEFVTRIYHNVFGKDPDADGLAYWKGEIDHGVHRGMEVDYMINAGLGIPDGVTGKAYIANRYSVAQYQTVQQLSMDHEMSVADLKAIMTAAGADAATVYAAQTTTDSALGHSAASGGSADWGVSLVALNEYAQLNHFMTWNW
ncbi:MAG TPA: DUF4214 domain-containing protein [Burkholderiaceae bacterium]|nr:DUF4214 domain-containing protein [Burkholderiaceae bacterium]